MRTRAVTRSAVAFTLVLLLTACNIIGGLSAEQRKSAEDALKALRKVEAATQAGVSIMNYQPLVIDAKAQVNEASSKLPEGELKKELEAAMEAYVDAAHVWGERVRTTSEYPDTTSDLWKSLSAKYQIPESNGLVAVSYPTVLSTIWKEASKHVERAAKLLAE